MADAPDLFARRNRLRIIAVMLLAALNSVVATALAMVAVVLAFLIGAIFEGGISPTMPTA